MARHTAYPFLTNCNVFKRNYMVSSGCAIPLVVCGCNRYTFGPGGRGGGRHALLKILYPPLKSVHAFESAFSCIFISHIM